VKYVGTFNLLDSPHVSSFVGSDAHEGTLTGSDSTHTSFFTGYIILDSTRYPSLGSFYQGTVFGRGPDPSWVNPGGPALFLPSGDPTARWAGTGDPPIQFTDTTWVGGNWVDGTYVDGTRRSYWYDPMVVNYALWYIQGSSNPQLIGYRYRDPVRKNVGDYYTSMIVPRTTGNYEIRWLYQKTSAKGFGQDGFGIGSFGGYGIPKDIYAHEIVQPFTCVSLGIDPDSTRTPLGFGESGFGMGYYGG